MLSSPPPTDPEDISGLIESVRSIWFASDILSEFQISDEITGTAVIATLDTLPLKANSTYQMESIVMGFQSSFKIAGTFYRVESTAVLVDQTVVHTAGSYTAVYDVNENDVRIRVTGAGRWRASTKITKL